MSRTSLVAVRVMAAAALLFLGLSPNVAFAVEVDAVIDFDVEGLPAGTILEAVSGNADGMLVGPILVNGILPSDPETNRAIIFDSANPTGGDVDLGTPNEDFGGPGQGAGGEEGSPFQNDVPLHNLLIIAQTLDDSDGDGLVDDPNDAFEDGMIFEFDFSTITEPFVPVDVTIFSITTIDGENMDNAGEVRLYDANGDLIDTFPFVAVGDNGVGTQIVGEPGVGVSGVDHIEVEVNGSNAIDNIEFSVLPEPGMILDQLWFPSPGDDAIAIIGRDGTPLTTASVPGLLDPTAVAIDPAGTAWVAFTGSASVARFDSNGNLIDVIPVGDQPSGIAVDSQGHAWVSNFGDGTVTKISSDGSIVVDAQPVAAGPLGIGIDPFDNVFVLSTGAPTLTKLSPDGDNEFSLVLPPDSDPYDVTVDRAGFAWIALRGLDRIERRASDGSLAEGFDLPGAGPRGIALRGPLEAWSFGDDDGLLYRLRPGGDVSSFPGTESPSGVAIDGKGFVWVTDDASDTANRFDPDGMPVDSVMVGDAPEFIGDATGIVQANVLRQLLDFDGDMFGNSLEVDTGANPFDDLDTPPLIPGFIDPITNLVCTVMVQSVSLEWMNPDPNPYEAISVRRDGIEVASLPPGSTMYAEPEDLPEGSYFYEVIGTNTGLESIPATCVVTVGGGQVEETNDIIVGGMPVDVFGITNNPNPEEGAPRFYLTNAGLGLIYGTDENFQVLEVFDSPFQGIAPTTGIAFHDTGNGGLGSLILAAGPNGDPNQVATIVEVSLTGEVVGGPYVLVFPLGGVQGEIPIGGGLGGLSKHKGLTEPEDVFGAIGPDLCEIYSYRLPAPGAGGFETIPILPDATATHPGGGFGLNGLYHPDFMDFDENGGELFVVGQNDGNEFELQLLDIADGVATQMGDPIPLAAASAENAFGGFILPGDDLAIVGITTSTVYEFAGSFFLRGDTSDDGALSLFDAVIILETCFGDLSFSSCVDAYDVDDDGMLNLPDALGLLMYLFTGGPVPAAPFPDAGPDPTPDALPCL